jgi:hypothetical protein
MHLRANDRLFIGFFLAIGIIALNVPLTGKRLDLLFYVILYLIFWLLERKYQKDTSVIALLLLVPVPHLLGVFGLYAWSIGNLTWDIVVHIASSMLGVLFLDSYLEHTARTSKWSTQKRVAIILLVVACSAILVEVVEAVGSAPGDGLFRRGPGDFCLVDFPCTVQQDTLKDVTDNLAGLLLGLVAIGYAHAFKERPIASAQTTAANSTPSAPNAPVRTPQGDAQAPAASARPPRRRAPRRARP